MTLGDGDADTEGEEAGVDWSARLPQRAVVP